MNAPLDAEIHPQPGPLFGELIVLVPLNEGHREALQTAAALDPRIWEYFPLGFNGAGADFDAWFDRTLSLYSKGQHFPYAVQRRSDHKIVGTTRLYDVHAMHRRLAIGSTWYAPDARGGLINFEVRLLVLRYVFQELGFNRVELITDPENLASQAAMKLLGAVLEGRIRNHLIYKNGRVRDSLLFSIVSAEWPAVEARLLARLAGSVMQSPA
jgi:N-acetyltransferase